MNPNQVYYSSTGRGPGRGRRILVVAGLLIIIAAAIGFFLYSGRSTDTDKGANKTPQGKDSGVVLSLSVAKDPKFVAPKDMKGFTKQSNFTADVGDYTTEDNGCNLQYGVVSSAELAGSTPQIIAINHLGSGADSGSIGGDPVDASDLVLKSVAGNQRYSMPTYRFDFSRDGVNYLASYSIVILPGGSRAFVRTYCANTGDPVSKTAFNRINSKAKEITIQTQ